MSQNKHKMNFIGVNHNQTEFLAETISISYVSITLFEVSHQKRVKENAKFREK